MNCPICGARLYQKEICKYCKITKDVILEASNKKVKQYRKDDRIDEIHTSSVLPKDVNKPLLIFYTILLGFFGVHSFYVYRNGRGIFSIVSFVVSVIFSILKSTLTITVPWMAITFELLFEFSFLLVVINILLWATDAIAVIIGTYKVPVVLPIKEKK